MRHIVVGFTLCTPHLGVMKESGLTYAWPWLGKSEQHPKSDESHLAAIIVRQHLALEPSAGLGCDTN